MKQALKEPLKFSVFLVLVLVIPVLSSIFIAPIQKDLAQSRQLDLVRSLVPGVSVKAKDEKLVELPLSFMYRLEDGRYMVFARTELLARSIDVAILLDQDTIHRIWDVNPGLPPHNARLFQIIQQYPAANSLDQIRFNKLLQRVVDQVHKAGGT